MRANGQWKSVEPTISLSWRGPLVLDINLDINDIKREFVGYCQKIILKPKTKNDIISDFISVWYRDVKC